MKKAIRTALIFWGIIALFPLFYLIYFFFSEGEGAYWLFGASDGVAVVTTWLDDNANRVREPEEMPLAGVCIWSGYGPQSGIRNSVDPCDRDRHERTDQHGRWTMFLPGGSCSEFFVFAKAPAGFQPTTDMASDGCDASFGFAPSEAQVTQKILTVEEFVQRQIAFRWARDIAITLAILLVAILGTIWLQKNP